VKLRAAPLEKLMHTRTALIPRQNERSAALEQLVTLLEKIKPRRGLVVYALYLLFVCLFVCLLFDQLLC
jgi:hypothetical protein